MITHPPIHNRHLSAMKAGRGGCNALPAEIVVVLGMHRSGTSALARGLIELGVDLGHNLMQAVNVYNDKGFWENLDIVSVNERLLERLGSRWDATAPIPDAKWSDPALVDLQTAAIELLSQTGNHACSFGFKDPRTTRLLPFWQNVFASAALCPGYVIALRNPLSVADSLHTRDGFAPEKSCLLWLQHLVTAVSETHGCRRVIVDYDRLLENAPRELCRIAGALSWTKPSAEKLTQSVYVRRFLTPTMRHSRHTVNNLSDHAAFNGIVKQTYELLLRVADDTLSIDALPSTTGWQQIESVWRELSGFLGYLDDHERRLRHALENCAAVMKTKAQLEESYRVREITLRDRAMAISGVESHNHEREALIAKLEREVIAAQRQMALVKDSVAWRASAPLRGISAGLARTKSSLGQSIRAAYIALPLDIESKLKIKSMIFSALRPVLARTSTYRAWLEFEEVRKSAGVGSEDASTPLGAPITEGDKQAQKLLPDLLGPVLGMRTSTGETLGSLLVRLPETPPARPDSRRVLMIDHWIPTPDRSSGSARLFELLRFMTQLGCSVELLIHYRKDLHPAIGLTAEEVGRYEAALREMGVHVILGAEAGLARLTSAGHLYSNVWLNFPEIAYEYLPWIRAHAIHARVIFDSVDLHYLRYAREAEVSGNSESLELADYYRKIERICASCADVTIAITERERALLMELAPGSRIEVISNVHELATHVPVYSKRKNIFFIGGFAHRPNVDAVHYFAAEIFPLIRKEIPDVEFLIVGSNMPESIRSLEGSGIRAIGYVEDTSEYFETSRVHVVPLRYGAGMKGKLGQALSYGLPSVTTSIGAEGMHLVHGQHALVADIPADFARQAISLYTDPILWARLSANGRTHLDQMFSPQSIKQKVKAILFDARPPARNPLEALGSEHLALNEERPA